MSHISGEPNSADRFHPLYDAIFRCPSCDFFAAGPSLLEAHLLTHEIGTPLRPEHLRDDAVPIEAVGAVSVPDAGVTIHKPLPCKYGCGQAFVDRGDLLRHYGTHRRQAAGLGEPEESTPPVSAPEALGADGAAVGHPGEGPGVVRTCRLCEVKVSATTVGEALRLLRDHHKATHRKPLERLGTAIFGEEKP